MPSAPANEDQRGGKLGRPPREAVYERLHVQIGELRDRLGGLPSPLESRDIWRGIWLEEAHHSTAIEGDTLVLKHVEQLLDEGRAVGDKELREYMEVQGYGNAADWVYSRRGTGGSARSEHARAPAPREMPSDRPPATDGRDGSC